MSTKPHRTPNRPITILMTTVMVLAGGCGVEPIQRPTFSSSTTSTTPPPTPVKYSATDWKSCPEVQQKLSGDLPPPQREDKQEGFKRSLRTCSFRSDDTVVVLSIQYWETTEDIIGVHPGAERAKKDFLEREQGREKDRSLNVGSDVRWRQGDTTDCTLEILDENAVVSVGSSDPKAFSEGNAEQCRGPARELAKQFYAAIQPQ